MTLFNISLFFLVIYRYQPFYKLTMGFSKKKKLTMSYMLTKLFTHRTLLTHQTRSSLVWVINYISQLRTHVLKLLEKLVNLPNPKMILLSFHLW